MGCAALSCSDATGPEAVAALVTIHTGSEFTCSLEEDAVVRCWGWNNAGQLGDGSTGDRALPTPIESNLQFQSVGIHGVGGHACAVTTDGAAYCWGENESGQLGNGTQSWSAVPVAVTGGLRFRMVSAGRRFSCGVTEAGTAHCWGRGTWGQLGNGSTNQSAAPVAVASNRQFESVQAGGGSNACALTDDAALYCWGLNWRGAIGTQTTETCVSGQFTLDCATTPVRIATPGDTPFQSFSVGASFACGVLRGGEAVCWGSNVERQLGTDVGEVCSVESFPDVPCARSPVSVDFPDPFVMTTAGIAHACGVTELGRAVCWGNNTFGQLGDGQLFMDQVVPGRVAGSIEFNSVSAGASHTCGATTDGALFCWGINDHFQLGNDTTRIGEIPVSVRSSVR
jgi:alpha-tubulin suppressor-like RCC1 family protein